MSQFARNLLLFGRLLRGAGLDVHHGRMIDAVQAISLVGVRTRADVRATLRALLVHRHDDLAIFDAAFELFFRHRGRSSAGLPILPPREPRAAAAPQSDTASALGIVDLDPASPVARLLGAYSAQDVSRTKDFAEFTDAEIERAACLLERLPWQLGNRRTRRWRRAANGAVDLRPVLRQMLTRGEVLTLPGRQRRTAPRPIVLIADVSGSMERYSRVLLHFVYGLSRSAVHVESFVFATRLTRLTPRLADRGGGRGVARVIRDVQDWGGGTRIGEAVRSFNTRWARRVMRNGPVVLIVSDGWDRGEPAVLAREMARLHRSCRRLIWLNPLLGSASYEPLTRGMQAALRHVDEFLPAHNLLSLEQLAVRLGAADRPGRRHGGRSGAVDNSRKADTIRPAPHGRRDRAPSTSDFISRR